MGLEFVGVVRLAGVDGGGRDFCDECGKSFKKKLATTQPLQTPRLWRKGSSDLLLLVCEECNLLCHKDSDQRWREFDNTNVS